jgi:hypothetical protein
MPRVELNCKAGVEMPQLDGMLSALRMAEEALVQGAPTTTGLHYLSLFRHELLKQRSGLRIVPVPVCPPKKCLCAPPLARIDIRNGKMVQGLIPSMIMWPLTMFRI